MTWNNFILHNTKKEKKIKVISKSVYVFQQMRSIQKCNISHEKYTAKFVIYRKKKKKNTAQLKK